MALKKDGVHFVLFPKRGYKVAEDVVLNNIYWSSTPFIKQRTTVPRQFSSKRTFYRS